MKKKWLYEILSPALQADEILNIENNYSKFQHILISNLGIDSINLFSIILNIEKYTKTEIDVTSISLEDLNTLEKIEEYINECSKNKAQH